MAASSRLSDILHKTYGHSLREVYELITDIHRPVYQCVGKLKDVHDAGGFPGL